MQPAQLPDLRLSVVVVTNRGLRSLFPILAALKDQTIASAIELIIVGPKLDQHQVHACCGNVFGRVHDLSVGPIENRGRAAARGIMAASAPFVALTENHCFPVSDWAERLLEGYDDSISGVGPGVLNANPETLLSWTMFALGYGNFAPTMPAETRYELPYHNSSYRTAVLKRLGNQLPELLADERRLFSELRESGAQLWFQPKAVTRHLNEARWRLVSSITFYFGWRYAAARRESWRLWQRGVYALAWPSLALPISRNLLSKLRALKGTRTLETRLIAHVWLVALFHAAGEAVGYVLGPRNSFPQVERDEFLIKERLSAHEIQNQSICALLELLNKEDRQ
jgi:hypothetical protein